MSYLKYNFLYQYLEDFLFSSDNVSLKFNSQIHFKLSFVQGERWGSCLILLCLGVNLSSTTLYWRGFSILQYIFWDLVKNYFDCSWFSSGISIERHSFVCLLFRPHTVLLTPIIWWSYFLNSGIVMSLALFSCSEFFLQFHINCQDFFYSFMKKTVGILTGIILNL